MIAIVRSYICLMANDSDIIDGGLFHHPSKTGVRPVFMEPLGVPLGVPPPRDGNYVRLVEGGGPSPRDGGAIRNRLMRNRTSSFPLKEDAGYIGYLTDDDESESSGSSESGGDASDVMMKVLNRRRRELMGSDISFSTCMFMMVAAGGLLLLFLFAASPWGVPPPRRL